MALLAATVLAPSAASVIQAAQTEARRSHRNVMVYFHASWCSWCGRTDRLLASPEFKSNFDRSYVVAKITVRERDELVKNENSGWEPLMKSYRGTTQQDVPLLAVLSPDGKKLSTGVVAKDGNIPNNAGFPSTDDEINQFVVMIKKTATGFDAADRARLKKYFIAHRSL